MTAKSLVIIACLLLLASLGQNTCMAAGPFTDRAAVISLVPPLHTVPEQARPEPKRLVAATLALTLGTFGAHRLYFGTDVKVPIIYGLTFGGFGVLVLIDLGHILFTRDLDAYMHNNKVLMWSRGSSKSVTAP